MEFKTLTEALTEGAKFGPVVEFEDRWYITMGFSGFNSSANNRSGYASFISALRAHQRAAKRFDQQLARKYRITDK